MGAITIKILKLEKQKHNEPKFDELSKMLHDLTDFLNEDVNMNDRDWNRNLNTILDFQDSDGSFRLFDSYEIPVDARVDFCYIPTYICTAILMKAYMTDPDAFTLREKSGLINGLKMSCVRNLRGHGFEAFKGQIETLNIFMKAGLNEFMDLHSDLCPEFSVMINSIISKFHEMEYLGDFLGPWGESYENEIRAINEYFPQMVFVYGTLMKGEANEHYLENSTCMGPAVLEGHDMYNVGWYPAIIPGDGMVVGELYRVPLKDIPAIDMLEGEGTLYTKKCETVTCADGKTYFALFYVYNGDCSGLERIPAWNREYVWYVSYGSNMLRERFMCYIEGGSYGGSRYHSPCDDTTPPLAVRTIDIPYDMYFGNESGSWHGSGVSFLDTTKKGKSLGVAYLITKKQLEHVAKRENNGRYPTPGGKWYGDFIDLEPIEGIEVKTITNNAIRTYNEPIPKYLDTLRKGIRENWPDMSDEEIEDYLNNCIR